MQRKRIWVKYNLSLCGRKKLGMLWASTADRRSIRANWKRTVVDG